MKTAIRLAFNDSIEPSQYRSVVAFHKSDYQTPATKGLDELVEYLSDGARAANRIWVVSGLAGTGKTHLLTQAASVVRPNVLPVIVYSPDQWKNFLEWLDEKFITALLIDDRICVLATQLVDHVFGESAPKIREQLQKDWGHNPFQEITERFVSAGRSLTLTVGPLGLNFGDMALKLLSAPFSTPEERLRKLASTLSSGLGLGRTHDCISLSAALLLCQTPYSDDAIHWLAHKTVPECLPNWKPRTSTFSTFKALASGLNKVGVKILLSFDQLDNIALDVSDGDTLALRQLIRECLQIVSQHDNVACVVSALQALYARTESILTDAEKDRLQARPVPVEMSQLTVSGVRAFLQPRVDYIRAFDITLADELEHCLVALGASPLGAIGVPPRFFIRRLGDAAASRVRDGISIDPVKVWGELLSDPDAAIPDRPIDNGVPAVDLVSQKWADVQADVLGATILPRSDSDALTLTGWVVEKLPLKAIQNAKISKKYNSPAGFDVLIEKANGLKIAKSVLLCNEPNYRGKLVAQIERLASTKSKLPLVLLRTRDPFPSSNQSAVRRALNAAVANGTSIVDPSKEELIRAAQLKRLADRVGPSEFDEWIGRQVSMVPALESLLLA